MQENQRMIRPGLAVFVLICFLMPFIKISCAGQPIASITGVDLAFGKKIDMPNPFGDNAGKSGFSNNYQSGNSNQSQDQLQFNNQSDSSQQFASTNQDNPFMPSGKSDPKVESQPVAAIALGLAIVALIGALGASRRSMQLSAAAAAITAVLLFVMKSNFNANIPSEMTEMLGIEWTWSFWAALFTSAVLTLFTVKSMSGNKDTHHRPRLVIQTYSDMPPSAPTRH